MSHPLRQHFAIRLRFSQLCIGFSSLESVFIKTNLVLLLAHQVDSDVLSPLVEVSPIALLIVSLCRLLIEKLVEIAILGSIAGAVLFLRGGP